MHNDSVEVHQHPTVLGVAFNFGGEARAMRARGFIYRVGQRAQLPFAGAGAEDEIIRKTGLRGHIQQNNIFGFFVF